MKSPAPFCLLFVAMLAAGAEVGAIEGVVVKATAEPIARGFGGR